MIYHKIPRVLFVTLSYPRRPPAKTALPLQLCAVVYVIMACKCTCHASYLVYGVVFKRLIVTYSSASSVLSVHPSFHLSISHSPALQTSPCVRRAIIHYRKNRVATKQRKNREAPTAPEANITRQGARGDVRTAPRTTPKPHPLQRPQEAGGERMAGKCWQYHVPLPPPYASYSICHALRIVGRRSNSCIMVLHHVMSYHNISHTAASHDSNVRNLNASFKSCW